MAEVKKEIKVAEVKGKSWWTKAIIATILLVVVYVADLWVVAGLFTAIAVLVIVIILLLNSLGAYFVEPPKGTTTFINAGDNLKAVWPNVGGHKMSTEEDVDGRRWLIDSESEEDWIDAFFHNSHSGTILLQKWLWNRFGVRFISIYWPQVKRHVFDIKSRRRLLDGASLKSEMTLKDRVVDSVEPDGSKSTTIVESLLFLVPRPVYLEGIELGGDNSKINLLLVPIYQQVIPALPVYYYKGDFFTQLDGVVESIFVDFCATHRVKVKNDKGEDIDEPLTYAHWLKLSKTGDDSPIGKRLYEINATKSYRDELEGTQKATKLVAFLNKVTKGRYAEKAPGGADEIAPSGIIQRFGFALVSFRLIGWEPHKDSKDLAKALLAKETERHTADGVRQKADGESYAIQKRAEGESSRYERLVTALVSKKVTPDVAAEVVRTQLRTENIGGKDSKIVTYVEGGASASVMVPASAPTTPVAPTSTKTTS